MNIEKGDSITLSGGNDYIVVSKVFYDESTYLFLGNSTNKKSYRICKVVACRRRLACVHHTA